MGVCVCVCSRCTLTLLRSLASTNPFSHFLLHAATLDYLGCVVGAALLNFPLFLSPSTSLRSEEELFVML